MTESVMTAVTVICLYIFVIAQAFRIIRLERRISKLERRDRGWLTWEDVQNPERRG